MAVSVPEPSTTRPWRPAAIVLLAHLLGNAGGSLRGSLQCRTADPTVLGALRHAAATFGAPAIVRRQGNWSSVQLSPERPTDPDPVRAWLSSLGLAGLRSREAFVPAAVAALPREQLALFLRHLWASGGSLGWKSGRADVSLVVAGRRLADDVALLLARFGVQGRVIEAASVRPGAPGWRVVIDTALGQRRFLDEIGAFGAQLHRAPLLLSKLVGDGHDEARGHDARRVPGSGLHHRLRPRAPDPRCGAGCGAPSSGPGPAPGSTAMWPGTESSPFSRWAPNRCTTPR